MDLKDDMAENLPKKKKSSKKGFFSEEIGHVNDPETKNETSLDTLWGPNKNKLNR